MLDIVVSGLGRNATSGGRSSGMYVSQAGEQNTITSEFM